MSLMALLDFCYASGRKLNRASKGNSRDGRGALSMLRQLPVAGRCATTSGRLVASSCGAVTTTMNSPEGTSKTPCDNSSMATLGH